MRGGVSVEPGLHVQELVVDSFAGGGGASTGIRMALGRDPDIAINHDDIALAMHRINHPATRHMLQDVATVDSVGMCAGLPIGMLWMSPDCTDHSKAKGGAPRRDGDRTTRGIGWAIVGWVRALPAWQRPRVVFLENVEEYVDWGPLGEDGKRCPRRKGETFKAFVAAWKKLGYGKIEWRQRRAWGSGSGTIRKRLYMVMRRDGEPIVWPEPTHGNPNMPEDAARIAAGELKPWVTAADCIDFTLPIPSIFDSSAEILRTLGIRAKRPLADKTQARIAKGVRRYVLDALRPFVVRVDQTSAFARNGVHSADEPVRTIHTVGSFGVVSPFAVKVNHTGDDGPRDRDLSQPLTAMTSKRDDALVMPFVAYAQQGGGLRAPGEPLHTITASPKDQNVLVAPLMVPRLQEKPGSEPRSRRVDVPAATITVSDALPGHLVAPYLVPRYGERAGQEPRTYPADQPGPTPVPTGNEGSLAVVHLSRQFGAPGHGADEPVSTITVTGSQQSLVAAHMVTLRGSERRDYAASEPVRTQSAKGQHDALVSLPLMTVYYGTDDDGAPVTDPMRTDTAKPRFGLVHADAAPPPFGTEHMERARQVAGFLRAHGCWDGGEFVTVEIDGATFVLVDICMRMLTPRERYNANGFPRDYVIDRGLAEDGSVIRFTLEQQGHMCGNAVCPTEAAALVAANYVPREVRVPKGRSNTAPADFFLEAAE